MTNKEIIKTMALAMGKSPLCASQCRKGGCHDGICAFQIPRAQDAFTAITPELHQREAYARQEVAEENERLRAALVSVSDLFEALLDAKKFPGKGKSTDDKNSIFGWWEDRYDAIKFARSVLAADVKSVP